MSRNLTKRQANRIYKEPVPHACAHTKLLFRIIAKHQRALTALSHKTGYSPIVLKNWRNGAPPLLPAFEHFLLALGYELQLGSCQKSAISLPPTSSFFHYTAQVSTKVHPLVQALFELLETHELHLRLFARHVGLHENTLYTWKQAKKIPTIRHLERCFQALGYTITITLKRG